MTFKEIFKMVKEAGNYYTYAGCSNDEILKAATQIYCKQMEVESNAKNDNATRIATKKSETGEASGS